MSSPSDGNPGRKIDWNLGVTCTQGIPRTLAYYYISLITNEKCQDFDTSEPKETEGDDWWQSTASPEWRTPQHVVALIKRCLGGIDLDPSEGPDRNR